MTELSDARLVSTPEAARLLGVPEPELTRLVKCLELTPERPGTRTQPRLWSRALVDDLAKGPEAAELREAVARKERIAALHADLAAQYPDWRQALGAAADALFNFNRYSKWSACSRLRRRELYELKDRVIRLFYNLGLARGVNVHTVQGDDVECETCEGAGRDWRGEACP